MKQLVRNSSVLWMQTGEENVVCFWEESRRWSGGGGGDLVESRRPFVRECSYAAALAHLVHRAKGLACLGLPAVPHSSGWCRPWWDDSG
jgi:hypothetical protein